MSTLLNIAIAEPSAIIRSGLEAVLKRLPGFRIQIIEIATAELLQETLRSHKPDMLIINPSLPVVTPCTFSGRKPAVRR